jgi:hypothetical protein
MTETNAEEKYPDPGFIAHLHKVEADVALLVSALQARAATMVKEQMAGISHVHRT